MRKQYHPMNAEDGLRVWDVDRLVRLAAVLPSRWVPLSEIWEARCRPRRTRNQGRGCCRARRLRSNSEPPLSEDQQRAGQSLAARWVRLQLVDFGTDGPVRSR